MTSRLLLETLDRLPHLNRLELRCTTTSTTGTSIPSIHSEIFSFPKLLVRLRKLGLRYRDNADLLAAAINVEELRIEIHGWDIEGNECFNEPANEGGMSLWTVLRGLRSLTTVLLYNCRTPLLAGVSFAPQIERIVIEGVTWTCPKTESLRPLLLKALALIFETITGCRYFVELRSFGRCERGSAGPVEDPGVIRGPQRRADLGGEDSGLLSRDVEIAY